jgi:hypothetical protein
MFFWLVARQRRDILYGSETKDEQKERWRAAMKLTRFPLIFILVWIFPFINRIQNWASGDDGVFWLYVCHP